MEATKHDRAATNFVRLEKTNASWDLLKSQFTDRFKLQPLALHMALQAMRQSAEDVNTYFDRFAEVAQQLQQTPPHEESTALIIAAFIQSLHPLIRQQTLAGFCAKILAQPQELSVAVVAAKETEASLSMWEKQRYFARTSNRKLDKPQYKRNFRSNSQTSGEEGDAEKKARSGSPGSQTHTQGFKPPQGHESRFSRGRPFQRGRGNFRGRGALRGNRGSKDSFQTDRVVIRTQQTHDEDSTSTGGHIIPTHPVPAEIGGKQIVFKYDLGADRSIVSQDWCLRNNITTMPTMATAQGFRASTAPSKLLGEFTTTIAVDKSIIEHTFFVEQLTVDGLFGADLAEKVGLLPSLPLTFPSESSTNDVEEEKIQTPLLVEEMVIVVDALQNCIYYC